MSQRPATRRREKGEIEPAAGGAAADVACLEAGGLAPEEVEPDERRDVIRVRVPKHVRNK